MSKTLHLTLKKKWFDTIASGEKKEEYRDIKPYWLVRFIDWKGMAKATKEKMCQSLINDKSAARWNFNNNYCGNIHYDIIHFRNGYSKDAPTISVECKGIVIREGNPKWGAVEGQKYFVIELGNIIAKSHE